MVEKYEKDNKAQKQNHPQLIRVQDDDESPEQKAKTGCC